MKQGEVVNVNYIVRIIIIDVSKTETCKYWYTDTYVIILQNTSSKHSSLKLFHQEVRNFCLIF
jgi:hypothetical protein